MKRMRRLGFKLIFRNALVIVAGFLTLGAIVVLGLRALTQNHTRALQERSDRARATLTRVSQESIESMAIALERSLRDKAHELLRKDAASLERMIDDNAFESVRQFLQKNVENDTDIIGAQLFVREGGGIRAWQVVTPEYPHGLPLPIDYDAARHGWKSRDPRGRAVFVPDAFVEEAAQAQRHSVRVRELDANEGTDVFEALTPVRRGGRPTGEILGYLRYTLTREPMMKSASTEAEQAHNKLLHLNAEAEVALAEASVRAQQSLNRIFGMLAIALAVLVVFSVVLTITLSRHITKPIGELTATALRMSRGDYTETPVLRTDDEIGVLAGAFEDMRGAIRRRDAELEAINRDLEQLVERRTRQLAEEAAKVSSLLDNMQQAVFAVGADGRVSAPVSKHAAVVFGQELPGRDVIEILFADVGAEGLSQVKTVLATVFGENDLQWDLMREALPARVQRGAKALRIDYSPLWSAEGTLDRIMFVVQDVTRLEKLEAERAQSERAVDIVREIAELDELAFTDFLLGADRTLEECTRDLGSDSAFRRALRVLHTVKGNARLHGLTLVSNVCHLVESRLSHRPEGESSLARTIGEIEKVRTQLREYATVAHRLLRIPNVLEEGAYCEPTGVESTLSLSVPRSKFEALRTAARRVPDLERLVESLLETPLKPALRECRHMVDDLARGLGKLVDYRVIGTESTIERRRLGLVRDVIVQLIRNAIDHGLETPAERESIGKLREGVLSVECLEEGEDLRLCVRDDGRGIDAEALAEAAVAKGLATIESLRHMSREERIQLAFLPGLSSRRSVTDVSGRGMGLDIVQATVERLGGTVELIAEPGQGTQFVLRIPRVDPAQRRPRAA